MFHAGGHKGVGTRGRSSGLGRNYPHFLGHVDWKAPLRCGILFCTFSCILFVIGVILTWLGIRRRVHDVFGESVPITGPILLAVGALMLLLAFRQFYLAHVRKKAHNKAVENKELREKVLKITGEEDEDQDEPTAADALNKTKDYLEDGDEACVTIGEKPPLISGGSYDSGVITSSCGDALTSASYIRPPVPLQSPYYSMALMVYKDPALVYGPYVSAAGLSETHSAGPVVAAGADVPTLGVGGHAMAADGGAPSSSPPQKDSAVLETPSTTLPQQVNPASTASNVQSTSATVPVHESNKIFPADYLTSYRRSGGAATSASAGISNLPNPTTMMMLRTLELQETI